MGSCPLGSLAPPMAPLLIRPLQVTNKKRGTQGLWKNVPFMVPGLTVWRQGPCSHAALDLLCNKEQVPSPLWASVSPSVKQGAAPDQRLSTTAAFPKATAQMEKVPGGMRCKSTWARPAALPAHRPFHLPHSALTPPPGPCQDGTATQPHHQSLAEAQRGHRLPWSQGNLGRLSRVSGDQPGLFSKETSQPGEKVL